MNIQRTKWVERNFNFDFPIGIFPSIYERLTGTAARIEKLVNDFSEKDLEQKINNGWSVKEHIGHLIDLEELHEGRIEDFSKGLTTLRPADMTNKKTIEASHNNTPVEKLILNFQNAREHFCKMFENKNEKEFSASSIHPRLNKPMRLVDMAFFVAEHDDHHIATMRIIIASIKA